MVDQRTDVVRVTEARTVDGVLLDEVQRLLPQLSSSSAPPSEAELRQVVESESTILLVARGPGGEMVGMLTLVLFRLPTGMRAWIEDVVVDEAARGAGIGAALVQEALARAQAAGSRTVDLTSRPTRRDANRLYQRLGFETRETNIYRHQGG